MTVDAGRQTVVQRSNRTFMELKLRFARALLTIMASSNRTFMELKCL